MTITTSNTITPCQSSREALTKAAANLRQAGVDVRSAEREMKAKEVALRLLYIKAREDRDAMMHAFHIFVALGQELQRLQFEVTSYDAEHERALKERNAAGDELDRAARVQGTPYMHSSDELERAAIRFAAAQQVLDHLQSKEATAKRRADAVALRQAESAIGELERLYRAKDSVQKESADTARFADSQWNVLRNNWIAALEAERECQKALRKASQNFAADAILQ